MPGTIIYQSDGGVVTITMDDGKANALGLALLDELARALRQAQSEASAIVLAGRPGMFSGGFDLAVFKRDPAELIQMLEAGARLAELLKSCPRPVVAACTGHAIAMGAFLLLSADLRIGVDAGARIQVNEVQVGLTVPHFAIELCQQRLAPAHLHRAVCTAAPYTPQEAVAAGFLDGVVPADALLQQVQAAAGQLAALPATAFSATKLRLADPGLQALRQAIEQDLQDWQRLIAH